MCHFIISTPYICAVVIVTSPAPCFDLRGLDSSGFPEGVNTGRRKECVSKYIYIYIYRNTRIMHYLHLTGASRAGW